METFPGTASVGQPQGAYPPEQLRFTGKGSEYFGIWIVNLLLTILTLGFYSPWAKVRRMHYFYRNTQLAGNQMSPALLAEALETIAKAHSEAASAGGYLASHPATAARLKRLRDLAASAEAK
jgi:Zn-dependent protease with chaperone function